MHVINTYLNKQEKGVVTMYAVRSQQDFKSKTGFNLNQAVLKFNLTVPHRDATGVSRTIYVSEGVGSQEGTIFVVGFHSHVPNEFSVTVYKKKANPSVNTSVNTPVQTMLNRLSSSLREGLLPSPVTDQYECDMYASASKIAHFQKGISADRNTLMYATGLTLDTLVLLYTADVPYRGGKQQGQVRKVRIGTAQGHYENYLFVHNFYAGNKDIIVMYKPKNPGYTSDGSIIDFVLQCVQAGRLKEHKDFIKVKFTKAV